jgi:hypothetical protein
MNIPGKGQEIIAFIHEEAFESSLEQVPVPFMAMVEINGVCCKEASHEFGKGGMIGTFQEEMKMIGHQTPGVNPERKNIGIFSQIFKKPNRISPISKGDIARIGSGEDMIKCKRQIYPFWTYHIIYIRPLWVENCQ